jgi:Icc-related predicted phosphoesterase
MKIQILSDLHREFGTPASFFTKEDIVGDVLVLAGDIDCNPLRLKEYLLTINKVPIFLVLGNHEFYGHNYLTVRKKYRDLLFSPEENLYLLDNREIQLREFSGYSFHGTTLWTKLTDDVVDMSYLQHVMNDYHEIIYYKEGHTELYNRLSPEITSKEHGKNIKFLKKTLLSRSSQKKRIVISHHLPSFQSVPLRFAGNKVNYAYATNLEEMILETMPVLWCHGHTHNSQDYFIGNTRIVCNPYGYFNHEENREFKKHLIIEV